MRGVRNPADKGECDMKASLYTGRKTGIRHKRGVITIAVTLAFLALSIGAGISAAANPNGEPIAPPVFCGNGVVSPTFGEECDGTNLNGETCQAQGFDGGTLACGADCRFDTSGCASCGDDACNGGETCSSCLADCGACAPSCGDGTCNGAETCSSCLADCGACPASACAGNDPEDKMVKVGPLCVDQYEASVWSNPGTQLASPYGCNPNGNDCTGILARSVSGVTPAAFITWFQAQQACANSGKRLLTNAEWQMAAAGTPDDSTNCNISSGSGANTGAFGGCVSNHGVNDMVGNLTEWAADWVPRSTTCGSWSFSGDSQCLAGAAESGEPGALIRGGDFFHGTSAGVFAVNGDAQPSASSLFIGFRCAR
jgi:hypothetical protein